MSGYDWEAAITERNKLISADTQRALEYARRANREREERESRAREAKWEARRAEHRWEAARIAVSRPGTVRRDPGDGD
jgi:hypothetical protein